VSNSGVRRTPMKPERRTRRSNDRGKALVLQLAACAARAGLEAMLLAGQDGLMASSPWSRSRGHDVATRLGHLPPYDFFVGDLEGSGYTLPSVAARGFAVGELCLVIGAVGEPGDETLHEMDRAIAGVSRILR